MPVNSFVSHPKLELSPNGARVSWESDCEGGGQVLLGFEENNLKILVYDGTVAKSHVVEAKNLLPGKTYFFRVSTVDDDGTPLIQSKVSTFTLPS